MKVRIAILALLFSFTSAKLTPLMWAQEMPPDYQQVLKIVGKSGDCKSNVLKVNVPRNDIHVTVDILAVPTLFGFGGWFARSRAIPAIAASSLLP